MNEDPMNHLSAQKFRTWITNLVCSNLEHPAKSLMEGTIKVKMRLMLAAVLKDNGEPQVKKTTKNAGAKKIKDVA